MIVDFKVSDAVVHHSIVNSAPLVLLAIGYQGTNVRMLGKSIGP